MLKHAYTLAHTHSHTHAHIHVYILFILAISFPLRDVPARSSPAANIKKLLGGFSMSPTLLRIS